MKLLLKVTVPLLVALPALPVEGISIQWKSALLGTIDADSSGAALDESWSFHLGAFTDPSTPPGWSPGPGNTAEWNQYWVTADVSGYFSPMPPIAGRFASGHDVTGIIPGFFQGQPTQGYIWGTNRAYPNAEWILMTNPSWTWPFPNPIDPTERLWEIDGNTVAIVGTVNQGGFQMQTAAVTSSLPPLLTGENWREIHFTPAQIANEEATVSGWDADPNRNGRPNILEFAFNANPLAFGRTNEPVLGTVEDAGNLYLGLTVTKDPNVAIDYVGETGSDLATWSQDAGNVVVQSAGLTQIVFRDMVPINSGVPARMLRVRVALP